MCSTTSPTVWPARPLPQAASGGPVRRAELDQYRGKTVDDLLGPGLKLLLVGINPGLWTAAVNAHFARPGNRFWPALWQAGIVDRLVDGSKGFDPADSAHLIERGIGITNVVNVATARADELTATDYRKGGERLRKLVRERQPAVVAVLGLTAYRQAFGHPKAVLGRQDELFEGAQLWLAPNPSGLNAHETVATLAQRYGEVADAAGIARFQPPLG
jgi:TDG/mug DNA glycosylase family protein